MGHGVSRPVPRSFYARDPRSVARELLGKVLVRGATSARIVEAEAYLGDRDPGSHAFGGRTRRNATMFGPPGHLYVYFTYGMHWCANVVCGNDGVPGAVLLRAGAPLAGMGVMRRRRGPGPRHTTRHDVDLCSGPAKLCQAFGISGRHDGVDLCGEQIRIVDDGSPPPVRRASRRIGLREGRGDDHRWRWFVAGEPNVSGSRAANG